MKEYLTGSSGFVGSRLKNVLKSPVCIAHKDIQQTLLAPFDRFFFLSTYGNMAEHEQGREVVNANVTDLVFILRQIKNPFRSFVYMSSSSVTRRRQTMYSRTKKAAEEILLGYMETYNTPICILRPFSITGIGEQPTHLIPTLIRSCLEGERMPFVPGATHDFIDVFDVVSGILQLSSKGAKGIFDLGTGIKYSNQEVLELVEEVTGKKANIEIVKNMRVYDDEEWVSRNFSARQFGWFPKKHLKQSIEEMVNAYE